ncbi:MAG: 4Fe-4S dicluster domain-containing protein [Bacteroides sp.]|jgi:Fe-S-cluster-containing hydrogenase component 2|nr:4Fe-4S dicluster domain-containing protein [Bacteroides sp.]
MNEIKETQTRRDFIRKMAFGTGGLVLLGNFGVVFRLQGATSNVIKGIVVDFTKCTGCRTCETVCSAFNHPLDLDGETVLGLGNPWLSNIKVHWFNPDVDIPMVCALCDDAPCIEACPVEPDAVTGRKAMYHDPLTRTVRNNPGICIGCGRCARACRSQRTGVIQMSANRRPFGMCNLCNGDPQCVKHCPFDALQYVEYTGNQNFRGLPPDAIARILIKQFYDMDL